jgi:hypothetical protein
MDVVGANYNVTAHNGHGVYGRRPLDVVDEYLASRWVWRSSDPARDARGVTTTAISRTIRGASGRCPYIEYEGAQYRSRKLVAARHMVNRSVTAQVNVEDLREIVLLDADGAPWSKLEAQPPWHRTPHDLHLRQQINRTRNRGLFEVVGVDDAVEAYAAFAREAALAGTGAVSSYARAERQLELSAASPAAQGECATAPPTHVRPAGIAPAAAVMAQPGAFNPAPRHGRASFAHVRR